MISASTSSSCSGLRTSTASAPMPRSVCRCSAKSPWRPRTPTRAVFAELPAADGKTFGGRDRLKSETLHRLAETARDFGDELRVGVVRRRLDDRLREFGGIARLEDPRPDEVALGAKLHHEGRV